VASLAHTFIALLALCNWHFCFFGALGLCALIRAALLVKERKYEEAREHGMTGVIHLFVALFS